MAYLKFASKQYLTSEDVRNLINYCIYPDKNPCYSSNISYNTHHRIDYYTFNFCYPHNYYHKQGKTICYHYVLSFDLRNEYRRLQKLSLTSLIHSIYDIPDFKALNIFISVHRTKNDIPEHLHIIVSSVNPHTGNSVFINFQQLKYQIGEILKDNQIALAGYSYCTPKGQIKLGDFSPDELYQENYF